ncbi:GGDEF domain-containing protein [Oceanospirillum sediminis]|uniref:diguanylate cyclase n=1 Tax=Oceanospirillum sediminis TaxID=2760088 RepID=A0A839IT90_9GAMM|nr:GGDEF domain-containing protein [Oceanospirillum sediminis]MBB1487874.1 GGDEF domain-containing protein [Oceanospirillum sediminis]
MKNDNQQLEEIITIESGSLSLREISHITSTPERLQFYEKKYPDILYSTLLMSLTHESYTEAQAKRLWSGIRQHMDKLNNILQRDVGLSVATLDYLTNCSEHLSAPKIIEQDKSDFVSRAATIDELTGLYIRDVFDVMIKTSIGNAIHNNTPLCLLMIDIDDFKQVNDNYGHMTGDKVLAELGACLKQSIRESDMAIRYGGEELSVIMPETKEKNASKVGERIRKQVEQLEFDGFSVTVSIGLGSLNKVCRTPETLISAADEALYEAKHNGKNQLIISQCAIREN